MISTNNQFKEIISLENMDGIYEFKSDEKSLSNSKI